MDREEHLAIIHHEGRDWWERIFFGLLLLGSGFCAIAGGQINLRTILVTVIGVILGCIQRVHVIGRANLSATTYLAFGFPVSGLWFSLPIALRRFSVEERIIVEEGKTFWGERRYRVKTISNGKPISLSSFGSYHDARDLSYEIVSFLGFSEESVDLPI